MQRFVLVEADDDTFATVVDIVRAENHAATVDGFDINVSVDGVVCVGTINDLRDAERAVLAAVRGARVVALGRAPRSVLDQLCDDLRKLGPLEHITSALPPRPAITDEQRALLGLLIDGSTLGEAAITLHISRRTADRRLQQARRALGAKSTTEMLIAAKELRL